MSGGSGLCIEYQPISVRNVVRISMSRNILSTFPTTASETSGRAKRADMNLKTRVYYAARDLAEVA
jgi:hypothetical protein